MTTEKTGNDHDTLDPLLARGLNEDEVASSNQFTRDALTRHKAEGQLLAVKARWIALAIIGAFLPVLNFSWEMLYYEFLLIGFALLGWAQLRVGRVGRSRTELRLLFADLFLLTLTFTVPNPFAVTKVPTAMQYQFDNFNYFYIFLAAATMAYSWRTMIAFGAWVAGIWMSAAVLVVFLGYKIPELSTAISAALNGDPRYLEFLDPNNVHLSGRFQEVLIFAIVASILAINGSRTNRLLIGHAEVARERSNLARHFPPNIVDQMASQDQPLGPVRSQDVAVMFADIVGFTKLAERQAPDETMDLLRQFHRLMEEAVFNNNGTLDKFLGDGIMATFGTPEPSDTDAENALTCARQMLAAMDKWNQDRAVQDLPSIKLSIGIHLGNVVLGDIGSERLLEFAVIGDAVNVASRLEALTRKMETQMVVSDALILSIQAGSSSISLEDFEPQEGQTLRGRDDPVKIWTLSP
jgi:adenylate cyclase